MADGATSTTLARAIARAEDRRRARDVPEQARTDADPAVRRLAARAKVSVREVVGAAAAASRALLPVPSVAQAPSRRRQPGKPRR